MTRRDEIDGFVEGLFNGKDEIEFSQTASTALEALSEIRALVASAYVLAKDTTKTGSKAELKATLKHLRELTPVIECEIHCVVLEGPRTRQLKLQTPRFSKPKFR